MVTVICFLCRVTFQEKEGLKDHLIYEHGVVFNLDFVSRASKFRTEHARMPVIDLNKKNNNRHCYKCQDAPPPVKSFADIPKIKKPVKVKHQEDVSMNKTLDETVPMPSMADESTVSEPVKIKPKNIRDKTNKYCDVCNITLDTRILFLSHCSNVHDVKFKGKSGQPLVIPNKVGVVFNINFASRVYHFRTEHAKVTVIDIKKKNKNRQATSVRMPLL